MAFPQTSVTAVPDSAVPGQLLSADDFKIVSYPCSEEIPPGRLVELVNGQVRLPQGTTLGKIVGVSLYQAMKVAPVGTTPTGQAYYQTGEQVSIVRRGEVAVEWTGTTESPLTAMNVRHSSTTATHRGKVTDAATSAGAGVEISAIPEGNCIVRDCTASGVAHLEVNFPG